MFTKAEARYESPASGSDTCSGCVHFLAPSRCELVSGIILPEDWCRFFEEKRVPAKSVAQRRAIAIAEHAPGKLYQRNKGLLSMDREDMHDFAATSEKGLPKKKRKGTFKI